MEIEDSFVRGLSGDGGQKVREEEEDGAKIERMVSELKRRENDDTC